MSGRSAAENDTIRCPQCSAVNPQGATTCVDCNAPLVPVQGSPEAEAKTNWPLVVFVGLIAVALLAAIVGGGIWLFRSMEVQVPGTVTVGEPAEEEPAPEVEEPMEGPVVTEVVSPGDTVSIPHPTNANCPAVKIVVQSDYNPAVLYEAGEGDCAFTIRFQPPSEREDAYP